MEPKAIPYFEKGVSLYKEGRFVDALRHFRLGLRCSPDDLDLLAGEGMAQLQDRFHEGACRTFQKVLAVKPEHGDALLGMAKGLLELDQPVKAVGFARRLLRKRPPEYICRDLGDDFARHSHFRAAASCFIAAIRTDRDCIPAYRDLGICLDRLGKTKAAIAMLEKARSFLPTDVAIINHLGDVLFDAGRKVDALKVWTKIPVNSHYDERTLIALQRVSEQVLPADDPRIAAIRKRLQQVRSKRTRRPVLKRTRTRYKDRCAAAVATFMEFNALRNKGHGPAGEKTVSEVAGKTRVREVAVTHPRDMSGPNRAYSVRCTDRIRDPFPSIGEHPEYRRNAYCTNAETVCAMIRKYLRGVP